MAGFEVGGGLSFVCKYYIFTKSLKIDSEHLSQYANVHLEGCAKLESLDEVRVLSY